MSALAETRRTESRSDDVGGDPADLLLAVLAGVPQALLGVLPRTCHRVVKLVMGRSTDDANLFRVLVLSCVGLGIGLVSFFALFGLCLVALAMWAHTFPSLVAALANAGIINADSGWIELYPAPAAIQAGYALALA